MMSQWHTQNLSLIQQHLWDPQQFLLFIQHGHANIVVGLLQETTCRQRRRMWFQISVASNSDDRFQPPRSGQDCVHTFVAYHILVLKSQLGLAPKYLCDLIVRLPPLHVLFYLVGFTSLHPDTLHAQVALFGIDFLCSLVH